MAIQWSDFELQSLEEIVSYYELEVGPQVADALAFIRALSPAVWEVIDIVHTSRKLPKLDGYRK
jgi:plasmid stabilization system protein ParE